MGLASRAPLVVLRGGKMRAVHILLACAVVGIVTSFPVEEEGAYSGKDIQLLEVDAAPAAAASAAPVAKAKVAPVAKAKAAPAAKAKSYSSGAKKPSYGSGQNKAEADKRKAQKESLDAQLKKAKKEHKNLDA